MRAGGESDKLANCYEGLWTIDQLFDVLEGKALEIEIEPLVDGVGVEFRKTFPGKVLDHHSVKVQTPNNGWTLATLSEQDSKTKRSFLGDLLAKTANDPLAEVRFVSQVSANSLRIISEDARMSPDLAAFRLRLAGSAQRSADFRNYVLPLFCGDEAQAYAQIRRVYVETITKTRLIRDVERDIERSFYRPDGQRLDVAAVRRLLAEFILDSIGQSVDRDKILARLASEGLRETDWARDPIIRELINDRNGTYLRHVAEQFINGTLISRREAAQAFDFLTQQSPRKFGAFIGVAGLGKTCATAELLQRFEAAGIVFLVIRMDVQTAEMTARGFGHQMGLPTSPVDVLAGIADGGPCILVVDQLDALSFASGRNQNLWAVLEDLLFEVEKYPNLRVWFSCREFDLVNDTRLRKLLENENAHRIPLALLVSTCINPNTYQPRFLRGNSP